MALKGRILRGINLVSYYYSRTILLFTIYTWAISQKRGKQGKALSSNEWLTRAAMKVQLFIKFHQYGTWKTYIVRAVRSVYLITNRGQIITTRPPPGFSDLPSALHSWLAAKMPKYYILTYLQVSRKRSQFHSVFFVRLKLDLVEMMNGILHRFLYI